LQTKPGGLQLDPPSSHNAASVRSTLRICRTLPGQAKSSSA
jgi:hypothetical protein